MFSIAIHGEAYKHNEVLGFSTNEVDSAAVANRDRFSNAYDSLQFFQIP